jgi:hypothetical protein
MENKKFMAEDIQTSHEATNQTRLQWTKPQLSPIDVAGKTMGAKGTAGSETSTGGNIFSPS